MKIKIGTFNLFQFCAPPFSWYTRKERFTQEQWLKKIAWIKNQIKIMDCDIIGFQEVFTKNELETLVKELGFKYFITVEDANVANETNKTFNSTTVALASKYPIKKVFNIKGHYHSLQNHNFKSKFSFSRKPIKALIELPNKQEFLMYVCHLKSNRLNEFEYVFTKKHSLTEKKQQVKKALENNYSEALKLRLCEASSLFFDLKKEKDYAKVLVCDLNDKEFSLTIDALSNDKYHDEKRKEQLILFDAAYLYKKKIINPHPEQKEIKRVATSYFAGKGNALDYIFISKQLNQKYKNNIAKVSSYEVLNKHLLKNLDGDLLTSDHAQVVCELEFLD